MHKVLRFKLLGETVTPRQNVTLSQVDRGDRHLEIVE
jgi:hypothetical protein